MIISVTTKISSYLKRIVSSRPERVLLPTGGRKLEYEEVKSTCNVCQLYRKALAIFTRQLQLEMLTGQLASPSGALFTHLAVSDYRFQSLCFDPRIFHLINQSKYKYFPRFFLANHHLIAINILILDKFVHFIIHFINAYLFIYLQD